MERIMHRQTNETEVPTAVQENCINGWTIHAIISSMFLGHKKSKLAAVVFKHNKADWMH